MDFTEIIKNRKSTRAFLNKEVDINLLKEILEIAKYSPSGGNIQPWRVAVVTGDKLRKLTKKIEMEFRSAKDRNMDYQYYPSNMLEPYKGHREKCTELLYSSLDIQKGTRKHFDQWRANYRGFDAPVILFFYIDSGMEKGAYLDCGMFIQSIMLAATSKGLATCTQASLAEFPELVKNELGYPLDCTLLCATAIGYEDAQAPVNSYRTPRMELESFVKFFS